MRGWESFEVRVRNLFGLRSTIGSGSKFYDQGDGVSAPGEKFPIYVEAKYTETESYSIKRRDYLQWRDQATLGGARNLLLAIRIWPRREGKPTDLVVMDMTDAQELIRSYNGS